MTQDTISTIQEIENPIFILPDYLSGINDSNNIGFKTYIINTLNSNLKPLVERKSLFTHKAIFPDKYLTDKPLYNNYSNSWIFAIFIIVISTLIVFTKTNPKHSRDLFSYGFSNKKIQALCKESGFINEISLLVGLLIFAPIFSLMLYSFFDYFSVLEYIGINSNILIYLIILLGSIAFFFVKNSLIYIFGVIFNAKYKVKIYLTNQIVFYAIKGIILIPFVFLSFFLKNNTPEILLFSSLIIFLIIFTIRLLRGFYLSLNDSLFSKVYLFFYLCTLELLPLVIAYKLIIG